MVTLRLLRARLTASSLLQTTLSLNNSELWVIHSLRAFSTKIKVAGTSRFTLAGENLGRYLLLAKGIDPPFQHEVLGSYTSGSGIGTSYYSAMRTITGGKLLHSNSLHQ